MYNEKRAAFINNFCDIVEVKGDLPRKIREGSYFEEVEWAVRKGYSGKDETAKLKIVAL